MERERLEFLENRVTELEQEMQTIKSKLRQPSPPSISAVTLLKKEKVMTPVGGEDLRIDHKNTIESLIAGRGLQIAGFLLILIGFALFLQLAFQHNWIGPLQRIILGLTFGSAIMFYAQKQLKGTYRKIGQILVGLGGGINFLTAWAAVVVYPELLIPREVSFAVMLGTIAVMYLLAVKNQSRAIGLAGVLGGFLTPYLLADGPPNIAGLAIYLLALTIGALFMAYRGQKLIPVAFGAFIGDVVWGVMFIHVTDTWSKFQALSVEMAFLLVFFAYIFKIKNTPENAKNNAGLLGLVLGKFLIAMELIFSGDRNILALILITTCLTAFWLMILDTSDENKKILRFSSLGAFTLALAAIFDAGALRDAYIIESAILVIICLEEQHYKKQEVRFLNFSLIAFVLSGIWLLLESINLSQEHGFEIAVGFLIWIRLGLLIKNKIKKIDLFKNNRKVQNFASLFVNIMVLSGLSRILVDAIGTDPWSGVSTISISLLWVIFAAYLVIDGLKKNDEFMRWQGLFLIGVTALKIFSIDLSSLELEYRVGSLIGTGIIMFALSAWYTRAVNQKKISI